ncbi:N-myc-interactor [Pygocentrus nattereri]|uniref:NID domain-containing protein n=1 Tax=Pygocentrus nattereri TaxID=42514 RepID=A0A3B4EQ41_PYGNA|nr:N-myc-interactor [Pygocentrus nattereri]
MSEEHQVNGESFSTSAQQLADALEELKTWKKKVEEADAENSRLLLEKMDAENEKRKVQQETTELMKVEEQLAAEFNKRMQAIQEEILHLHNAKQDLQEKLQNYKEQLKSKKAEADSLQQRFKIKAQIPKKKMKFTHVDEQAAGESENGENVVLNTRAVFTITQRPSILLKGGQALITFEEEKVADQILRLAKCSVTCDRSKIDVKPHSLSLDPSVKFEVHITVSKKTIKFSNVPPIMAEERMRDRLELSFSKPSRGGGEVERVEYDSKTGTGRITFLNTGVAEDLVLKQKFYVSIGHGMEVNVAPLFEFQLRKFQTFSGVPKRTVLLKGIQDVTDEEDLQDHLEIHFQKPSNYGGEVESIKYVSAGKELTAFFVEDSAEVEAQ